MTPTRSSRVRSSVCTALVAGVSASLALAVGLTTQAVAGPDASPRTTSALAPVDPPPAQPTSDDQIQNIDQVRTAIKAYYGDTVTEQTDPINGTTALHTYSPQGAYAKQTRKVVRGIQAYLEEQVGRDRTNPAIVLDVDDTSLNTYNYEIYANFAYTPTSNGAFVNSAAFPKVPRMPNLAQVATRLGYTVFFLTGRPEAQRDGTVTNLAQAGFPEVPADHLILKDQTQPYLASCAPSCTTVQYKSLSRAHIKSQGFDIVANVGDQFSDLEGGRARQTFKMPNPMYFLP